MRHVSKRDPSPLSHRKSSGDICRSTIPYDERDMPESGADRHKDGVPKIQHRAIGFSRLRGDWGN